MKALTGEELVWTLLRDRGFRAHWGQSAEDAVLERVFGRKKGGTYVDIGCHHPRELSNTFIFHRFYGWTGVNIDASPDAVRLFQEARPKDITVHAMIGDGGDEIEFVLFKDRARSTADAATAEDLKRRGFEVLSTYTMRPQTLTALLDQHLAPGRAIDLLTIDIEGFDLSALATLDWDKYRPRVICIEDHGFKHEDGDTNIRQFMRDRSYKLLSHCYDTSIYGVSDWQA